MTQLAVRGADRPALVDDRYEHLARYQWKLDRNGYVIRSAKGRKIMLHHVVMAEAPSAGLVRDHINRDKLDNRLCNLRWVSRADNNRNRSAASRNATGFRGVRLDPASGRYLARIQTGGVAVVREWFDTPEAANDHLTAVRRTIFPVSNEAA